MNKTKLDSLMCDYLQKRSTFEFNTDITKKLSDILKNKSNTVMSVEVCFSLGDSVHIVVEEPYSEFVLTCLRDSFFKVTNMARVNSDICLDKVKEYLHEKIK